MCTIHANSAREAVTKMCTLPLLAGENVGQQRPVPANVAWSGGAVVISRQTKNLVAAQRLVACASPRSGFRR